VIANQFEQFRQEAINYCSLIETNSNNQDEFVDRLQLTLTTLYQLACQLPEVAPDGDCNAEISDADFSIFLPQLSNLLPFQYYWQVIEPFDHSNIETGCGDLFDDIGDIYKDLKRELFHLSSNDSSCKHHGCWMVKWDFEYHWGQHCIDALKAIHHFKRRI
jgi:hypothetical protein